MGQTGKKVRGVSQIIGTGTWSIDTLFERTQSDERTKGITNPEQLRVFIRNRPELFDLTPDDEVSCRVNNPYLGTAESITITIGSNSDGNNCVCQMWITGTTTHFIIWCQVKKLWSVANKSS